MRTQQGDFTGFVQWNREKGVGSDELAGRAAEGEISLRFDTIRAIARSHDSSLVTLVDGREIVLYDHGDGNAGLLIFLDGVERPEYVPWTDVGKVDFDRPPAMYPPFGGR